MKEITVQQLQQKIKADESFFLLDVRQPFEKYQSNIEHDPSALIPVEELANRMNEVEADADDTIVCLCRSGSRSANACQMLEQNGYKNAINLKGGINQWAKDIDPSLPVY